eukprot:729552-Pyramimonas_sp.AAC.1
MGEPPQFASASQEFKEWFGKMRADAEGGKHQGTLRQLLEAQAVPTNEAQRQAGPPAADAEAIPAGGADDDMELDEQDEEDLAAAGEALLEARRAAD